jgi:AcrR family transcriptional regulator
MRRAEVGQEHQLSRARTLKVKQATMPQQANDEPVDRRSEILAIAATLFTRRGFDGVSIREIADAAGISGPSLYHHFDSKNEIYLEVHRAALGRAAKNILAAIAPLTDPWERLERACACHLETQLDPNSVTLPLMSDLPAMSGEMRVEVVRQRDDFEMIYRRLIAVLPLRPEIDREIYRLSLVSLINTVPFWYRRGRLSPDAIAEQIAEIFRDHTSEHADRIRAMNAATTGPTPEPAKKRGRR